jgi:GNAT superfamily N-acetyltransferase
VAGAPQTAPVQITEATEDDLAEVCELRLAFLCEVRALDLDGVAPALRTATSSFLTGGHADGTLRTWLARGEEGTLGVVSLLLTPAPPLPDDDRTRDGLVINMYVVPAARTRGVGRALLTACTAGARDLGVRRLGLYTTDDGRPLYDATGFRTNDDWMERRLG